MNHTLILSKYSRDAQVNALQHRIFKKEKKIFRNNGIQKFVFIFRPIKLKTKKKTHFARLLHDAVFSFMFVVPL